MFFGGAAGCLSQKGQYTSDAFVHTTYLADSNVIKLSALHSSLGEHTSTRIKQRKKQFETVVQQLCVIVYFFWFDVDLGPC